VTSSFNPGAFDALGPLNPSVDILTCHTPPAAGILSPSHFSCDIHRSRKGDQFHFSGSYHPISFEPRLCHSSPSLHAFLPVISLKVESTLFSPSPPVIFSHFLMSGSGLSPLCSHTLGGHPPFPSSTRRTYPTDLAPQFTLKTTYKILTPIRTFSAVPQNNFTPPFLDILGPLVVGPWPQSILLFPFGASISQARVRKHSPTRRQTSSASLSLLCSTTDYG